MTRISTGSGPQFPEALVTLIPVTVIPREAVMAQATARHILVDSEEACEALKTEIENGADFAVLAREHSNCPSGGRGGDLGSFGPGMMVPEFDKVVFSAPVNAVQGPVQTQFGFHLIEVTSRDE
jgi:peptidyl-prolyl cis-trans isomerase C